MSETPKRRRRARSRAVNRALDVRGDATDILTILRAGHEQQRGVTYQERRDAVEIVLRLRRRVQRLLDLVEHLPCEPEPETMNTTTLTVLGHNEDC